MTKKLLALGLTLTMALSLAACGGHLPGGRLRQHRGFQHCR